MEPIEITDLVKVHANGVRALDGVSFSVGAGEVFGFLGPNGAGKTTTINVLLGFTEPTSGSVRVCGGDPRQAETRRCLGFMPELAYYYAFLTVTELLRFYGRLSGMSGARLRQRSAEMVELVGLSGVRDRRLGEYSKGMRQRAGIAQALLHDPTVLILDEPMTGLDPLGRRQMRDIILALREAGKTVLFSSHELSEAELVCDRVAVLQRGQVRWLGPVREVAGDGEGNLERVFLSLIDDAAGVGR